MMLRSLIVLSCAALAAASSSASPFAAGIAAAAAAAAPRRQQQRGKETLLWYPSFSSSYESGTCTTSPPASLLAFAAGSSGESAVARADLAGCCEKWFGHQEGGACLGSGGEGGENDAGVDADAPADAAPARSSVAADLDDEDSSPESGMMWYPRFDLSYDAGRCVRLGIGADLPPPAYYASGGVFLHGTMEGCCAEWFGDQEESGACLLGLQHDAGEISAAGAAGVDGTSRARRQADAASGAVVEPRGADPIFVAAEKA